MDWRRLIGLLSLLPTGVGAIFLLHVAMTWGEDPDVTRNSIVGACALMAVGGLMLDHGMGPRG